MVRFSTIAGSTRFAVPDCDRNAHLDVECNGLAVDSYTGSKGDSAVLARFICSSIILSAKIGIGVNFISIVL